MSRRAFRVILSLAAVAILAGASCTHSDEPRRSQKLPTSPTALPTFSYETFQDVLDDLHGKVVVVNFWATWCGPCKAEAPVLSRVSHEFAGRVQFIGVDVADQTTQARAFIRQYGWPYPSVADPKREIQRGFGLLGQPYTLVYNAQGRKVQDYTGPSFSESSLRTELSTVLAQSP
jgi:thiol-disulfide isomerase/thioredoxin